MLLGVDPIKAKEKYGMHPHWIRHTLITGTLLSCIVSYIIFNSDWFQNSKFYKYHYGDKNLEEKSNYHTDSLFYYSRNPFSKEYKDLLQILEENKK